MEEQDSRDFVSMRWPIRNQILVPFAVVQIAAVAVISAAATMSRMLATIHDNERASLITQPDSGSGMEHIP